jgi:predicted RNA-binding protein with TRAM domain
VEAFRVELEQNVASHLIGPGASRLTEIEALAKRRFFLEGKAGVPVDHFKVKAEGKLADIAPKSPVEEGAEIRLELVEVGQHDIAAGVGKLDGLTISVADGSKLVGKKVKVRIERVLNGAAYATLVQTAAQTAKMDAPITAESEAEKPTRAPRKKKVDEAAKPAAERPVRESRPVEEAPPTVEEMPVVDAEAEEPEAETPAGDAEPPKPKKKTRRGSRGGRNRRKKPAAAAAAENGQTDEVPTPATAAENGQTDEAPTPATIHVPSPELGQTTDAANADGEQPPKKKRTRRGSRGGRNRRKKPAAASSEAKTES